MRQIFRQCFFKDQAWPELVTVERTNFHSTKQLIKTFRRTLEEIDYPNTTLLAKKLSKSGGRTFSYHRIIHAVRSSEPFCIVSSKVPKALAPVGTPCRKRCHCMGHRFTPTRMYKRATSKDLCNISTVVSNTYLI